MRVAYIDCSAGAAGDMLLGALVGAGASQETVGESLQALGVEGWDLAFESTKRSGISATRAVVSTTENVESRLHSDIVKLLTESRLDSGVKDRAVRTFDVLARAEAKVHGIAIEDVHFHEVGALDALVDIVGCCAALESLGVDRVVVSPVATGTGMIRSAHGEIPLPAPAVTEIFSGTNATLFGRGERELITPTGAAILVAAADDFASLPPMSIERTGYGAGTADLEFPNVVRVLVGSATSDQKRPEGVVLLETNLDDMSPELFPHVLSVLLDRGAHDAWVTPIVMKKGRPAFTLSVLCEPDLEDALTSSIFRETTTLGVRVIPATRTALKREWVETEVAGNRVRVKIGRHDGEITTVAPEHDDALAAAKASGLPLKQIYASAVQQVKGANGKS